MNPKVQKVVIIILVLGMIAALATPVISLIINN